LKFGVGAVQRLFEVLARSSMLSVGDLT